MGRSSPELVPFYRVGRSKLAKRNGGTRSLSGPTGQLSHAARDGPTERCRAAFLPDTDEGPLLVKNAEGDLVMMHNHSVLVPGTPGRNIIDIFRVEGDKVVEHWDVIQDIPEQLFPPLNDNGLF